MSSIVIAGDTSGTCTLQANAIAGTTTLTLPTTSGYLFSSAAPGTLGVASGGTGVTTLTGLAYGNGTSAFTAASAANVVAVIGSTAVANATYATSAGTATNVAGSGITGSQNIPYAALPTGSVLQVVTVNDTTQYTYSNGSSNQTTYQNVSGLAASITPKFSTSKILVLSQICASQAANSYNAFFRTTRNGTAIGTGNSSGYNGSGTSAIRTSDGGEIGTVAIMYLDSPATTSSVTYQIQICNSGGSSAYSYVNRPANSNTGWEQTGASSIILMEIAG